MIFFTLEHDAPETVGLVLAKKRAPGPKATTTKEVDVTAAFAAVKKQRGSLDGYKKWLACGFMLRAAFGEDGLDMLIEWSRESDGFVSDDDVRKKWKKDICAPDATKCPKEAFWAYARNGGYTGGLPDGIALAKNTTKVILDDVVGSLKLFRDGDGTAYARVRPRRVLRIDSIEFSDWLRRAAHESGTTPSQEQISLVVATARAHAYDNIEEVHLRVAKKEQEIFVDMCDADDRVLELSAKGARFIEGDEVCPVVFRRSKQLPLRYAEGKHLNTFLRGLSVSLDPVERFRMTIGEPDPYQIEIMRTDPERNPDDQFVTCLASRQVGKSTTIAALAWDDATRGKTVLIAALMQRQSMELLRRVIDFKNADPFAPRVIRQTLTELELQNGGRVISIPATDGARGFTADTVVLDEASFLDDSAIAALLPTRKSSGRVLMISTANGRQGFFYDTWMSKKTRRIYARSVDIPRLTEKVAYDRRFMNDLRFRSEHLCEFLGGGVPLIGWDVLDRSANHEVKALCLT